MKKSKTIISLCLSALFSLMLLFTSFVKPVNASPTITVQQTFTAAANPDVVGLWSQVERIKVNDSNITQELFITDNEHKTSTIVKGFGNDASPNSQLFLLHKYAGWNTATKPYPVLFVHGAGSDGDFAVDPERDGTTPGLAQSLAADGYAVFAITFAHPHGDNYIQREVLAAAIQRIKDITGKTKVDLIAHSKGNMSSRMYVSDVKKSWGTAFRNDVRRYIQLGAPNGGIDYTFRNTWAAWGIMATGAFGPVPYTYMTIYGWPTDTSYHSIYNAADGGGAYPGQAQMLAKWDDVYDLDVFEQDWYTTYYGGWGYYSYSEGIDYAINQGGNLINTLINTPVNSSVQIATLAGNVNVISGVTMEDDGPSDGILFVDSATMTDPMISGGATLLEKTVMNLNHVQLAYDPTALTWIKTQLSR